MTGRSFSVMLTLAAICVCTLAEAKDDLKPSDFPLQVEVLSFERHTTVRDAGSETKTNCLGGGTGSGTASTYDGGNTYNIQTNTNTSTSCKSTTEHQQYVYPGAGMQVKIGDRIYAIECRSHLPGLYSKLSKCAPLQPGQYAGRWHSSDQLEILSARENGKYTTVTYNVKGSAALEQPAAQPQKPNDHPTAVPAAETSGAAKQSFTELTITSTPAGADITIDSNFVGNTPSVLSVATGDHTIAIKLAGYEPWERKIHSAGGKVNVTATLVAVQSDSASQVPSTSKEKHPKSTQSALPQNRP